MYHIVKHDEEIEDLQYKNFKIIQKRKGFRFGMDAILAASFAEEFVKDGDNVIDLGTGSGIIGLLILAHTNAARIVGLEIQEDIAEMAQRTVILNKVQDRMEIKHGDIKQVSSIFQRGSFKHVVSNPPYRKYGSGIVSDTDNKAISRHEILCTLEDVVKAGSYLLTNGGIFTMVHRPDRLNDIILLMRKHNIEPKFMRFVHPKLNAAPNLLLVRGVKGGKPFLKIDRPLIIFNEEGTYTDDVIQIYNRR